MVDDLSNRIAARSERAVWTRTFPFSADMDPAQARGYVRARSRLVVARELQIATAQVATLPPKVVDQIRRGAIEQVVRKTLANVALHQPVRLTERAA